MLYEVRRHYRVVGASPAVLFFKLRALNRTAGYKMVEFPACQTADVDGSFPDEEAPSRIGAPGGTF